MLFEVRKKAHCSTHVIVTGFWHCQIRQYWLLSKWDSKARGLSARIAFSSFKMHMITWTHRLDDLIRQFITIYCVQRLHFHLQRDDGCKWFHDPLLSLTTFRFGCRREIEKQTQTIPIWSNYRYSRRAPQTSKSKVSSFEPTFMATTFPVRCVMPCLVEDKWRWFLCSKSYSKCISFVLPSIQVITMRVE